MIELLGKVKMFLYYDLHPGNCQVNGIKYYSYLQTTVQYFNLTKHKVLYFSIFYVKLQHLVLTSATNETRP